MSEIAADSVKDRRIISVVFIVAVITGTLGIFLLSASRASMTVTKKTPSLVTAIALESAINSIHLEYGRIPNIGHRMTTDSPDGIKLLNILLGSDAVSDDALNTREIKFLSVREGKNHRNGLIFAADSNSVLGLYDPWGSPYTVILNPENKEPLRFKHGSRGIELKDRRSAAFSPGPDKQIGTSDDVKTW